MLDENSYLRQRYGVPNEIGRSGLSDSLAKKTVSYDDKQSYVDNIAVSLTFNCAQRLPDTLALGYC